MTMIKRRKQTLGIWIAAIAAMALSMPSYAQEDVTPMDVVNGAIEDIKAGLADNRQTYLDDEAALIEWVDSLLAPRFDRNYAGRLVLARHWRGASNDQKRRFIQGFYNAMLSRYATGILEFREDRLKILPQRGESKENRATIYTEVTLDDGSSVVVEYRMVKRGDAGWQVFDVSIDGISYVRNFRAEIDAEIKKTSLDAVIERLESEAKLTDEAA
ncbi:MAG: ABC transporter substrate-binding protein [Pseudomonadota bacterium]